MILRINLALMISISTLTSFAYSSHIEEEKKELKSVRANNKNNNSNSIKISKSCNGKIESTREVLYERYKKQAGEEYKKISHNIPQMKIYFENRLQEEWPEQKPEQKLVRRKRSKSLNVLSEKTQEAKEEIKITPIIELKDVEEKKIEILPIQEESKESPPIKAASSKRKKRLSLTVPLEQTPDFQDPDKY